MGIGALLLFLLPVGAWRSNYSATLTFPEARSAALRSIDDGLACKTKLSTFIGASSINKEAQMIADRNEEPVSIRLDRAKHEICLITATMVNVGKTEGCGLKLLREDDKYVVAGDNLLAFETVIFDKSNHTAVWTKAARFLGLTAESHYLECQ